MGLLSSIKARVKRRPTLWYNQYDRCLAAHIKEAWILRYDRHEEIDRIVYNRRKWQGIITKIEFADEDQLNLHHALDWKLANQPRVKVMTMGTSLYIYANDDFILESALQLPGVTADSLTRVELRGQPGTISLRKSLYTHRSYFRWAKTTSDKKEVLRNLLLAQDDIKLSPSFAEFLNTAEQNYICDHYYIDHSNSNLLTMLSLVIPGVIRKTIPITTYK